MMIVLAEDQTLQSGTYCEASIAFLIMAEE
jgi:hypothetical protein